MQRDRRQTGNCPEQREPADAEPVCQRRSECRKPDEIDDEVRGAAMQERVGKWCRERIDVELIKIAAGNERGAQEQFDVLVDIQQIDANQMDRDTDNAQRDDDRRNVKKRLPPGLRLQLAFDWWFAHRNSVRASRTEIGKRKSGPRH